MKAIRYLLIFLTLIFAGCASDDDILDLEKNVTENVSEEEKGAEDTPDDGKLRVLAIGNSFSEDAVEHYLYELAQAEGKEIIIGNARISKCDLQKHLDNIRGDKDVYDYIKIVEGKMATSHSARLSQILVNEKWDYISLQQVSDKSGQYNTFGPLDGIIEYVTSVAPHAKIIWHSTWAYREGESRSDYPAYEGSQMIMYEAIQDATRQVLHDYPQISFSVPSGTAIQNMRGCVGDILNRDIRHLEITYGRYTAACAWFEALYGIDVTYNSYFPSSFDEYTALQARASAHAANVSPYSVTDLSDYIAKIASGYFQ